ncbi:hypothetical protein HSX11_17135 [Oxalobacteraceae bacterium]|nr:hypothetical protein [Oxalobacteraceae bacterium]
MKKRVVITGIGALNAHGHSIQDILAKAPAATRRAQAGHTVFDRIEGFDGSGAVSGRLKKKLDTFTFHGLCAAGMALDDSGLMNGGPKEERIGIFVGNCLGGWGFTEPKLKALHTEGVDAMGPYVATAWFPAALQGQISLEYGLKGYSKTFSADGVAGLQALGYAVEAIVHGRADAIVCGASEDLSSDYVRTMLERSGQGSAAGVFGAALPSSFGEGAAFLVLETLDAAQARGATIYCEVTGFADHFCASPATLDRVFEANTAAALGERSGPALLVADGLFEAEAARNNAARPGVAPQVADSKASFGNQFALSGVLEAACAAYELRKGSVAARRFDAAAPADARYSTVLLRRLGRQGGITTLAIAAV